MGKGFTLKNAEGRDLSDLLHEAFERKVSFGVEKKKTEQMTHLFIILIKIRV
jgi:hypothetical protein